MIGMAPLPENFRWPYVGGDGERVLGSRWHLGLSAWFRDYAASSPDGGPRCFRRRSSREALVVFLCGIWYGHGAGVRGLGLRYHATLILAERAGSGKRP